jgi:hypothetical protein
MTLKTSGGIFAGVDDELTAAAACLDVAAAGAVAGFTAGLTDELRGLEMDASVWASGENARVIAVTIRAGLVADEGGAGDLKRGE